MVFYLKAPPITVVLKVGGVAPRGAVSDSDEGGGDKRGSWGAPSQPGGGNAPGSNRRPKLLDVWSGTPVEQELDFLFAASGRCRFRYAARPLYKRASVAGIANVAVASFMPAKRNPH
ncbi:hypothetical protein M513_13041 [Trichuris suis]|uniref:Uncharacterized protein n=1 Tax=Trichuris suis TaxID=68888 RepID=A0A085LM78_9BILA|nr:hypothetical protein M513_13041 [Trichuris suis]